MAYFNTGVTMLNELNEKLQSEARDAFTRLRDKVQDATYREIAHAVQSKATSEATAVSNRFIPVIVALESTMLNDLCPSVESRVDEAVADATRHAVGFAYCSYLSTNLRALLSQGVEDPSQAAVEPLSAVIEQVHFAVVAKLGNSTDHVASGVWHFPALLSVSSLLPSALSHTVESLIRSNVRDLVFDRLAPLIDVNSGAQHAKAKELS
jgi:hypothetical protein